MEINRNNYEIYFLDYRENKLSPGDVAYLMLFLENNPDLKKEFEEFDNVSLIPDQNIVFEPKASLKKQIIAEVEQINAGNYENFFIAYIENQLNAKEKADLQKFVKKNSFLIKEFELFKKSTLTPDLTIVYNNKSGLYKKTLLLYSRRIAYYAASAAAILVFFFSLYLSHYKIRNNEIPISKYDNENIVIERNITSEIEISENREKALAKINNTTGVESIIDENIATTTGEINVPKKSLQKTVAQVNFTKIDRRTSSGLRTDYSVSDNFCFEQREYIYDVFRKYKNETIPDNYFEPVVDESKTILSYALSKFTGIFRKNNEPDPQPGNITFWDIADAGITGFNKLTQNDVQLTREYDNEGKLTSLALVSDGVEVYRKRSPNIK